MFTTSSTPLFNIPRETGWSPIEMWLSGVEPNVTGAQDVNQLLNTIRVYGASFQQPKFCADKNGKVVDCKSPERVEGGATGGGNNNPIYGQNPVDKAPDDSGQWTKETIWTDKDGNIVAPNTPGATPNEMWSKGAGLLSGLSFSSNSIYTQIFIGALALIIIAIAIFSLR